MDELDRRLIIELENDPRQSNKHLALTLGINEATVRRRIENLVSSGTIILTALPDLKLFGYQTRVFVLLQAEQSKLQEIGEQLCRMSNVRFVVQCVGFAEFFITSDLTSLDSLGSFITEKLGKVNGITGIETMLAYQELKRTHGRIWMPQASLLKTLPTENQNNSKINTTDHQLILQLQKDARTPLKELAQIVGVSEVTIHRRIKELVNSRVIQLTAIPDNNKIGYNARCFIMVRTELAELFNVAESMVPYPQVHFLALISGPTQIMVGIRAPSNEILTDFVTSEISKIAGIRRIDTLTFLKILKQDYTWIYK